MRISKFWIYFFIAAWTGYAFIDSLHYPFINYDTEFYLTKNPMMQESFSWGWVYWAFTTMRTGDWQPLVWLFFYFIKTSFGLQPAGFHAVNIVLHILNALLVYAVFESATRRRWTSFFLAVFFAVHPLRVESVVWTAELKDVLSGFFWWLTIGAYLKMHQSSRPLLKYAVFFFFVCGILSKPIMVAIPVVLLLFDFWPLGRLKSWTGFGRLVIEKIPFFLLSVFSALMTLRAVAFIHDIRSLESVPFVPRLLNAAVSCVMYIWKTLCPFRLAIFYPFPHPETRSSIWMLMIFLILTGMSFGAWKVRRRAPYVLWGWLWYLVVLLPVIGLLRVSDQAMADRYTYLPSMGLLVMAIWGISDVLMERAKRVLPIIGLAFMAFFMITTRMQVSYWRSPEILNLHALSVVPGNYIAATNLGYLYYQKQDYDQALKYFKKSLKHKFSWNTLVSVGGVLVKRQKFREAENLFLKAIHRFGEPRTANAQYNLGTIYLYQSKKEEAENRFRKALEINRYHIPSATSLSRLWMARGEFQKAGNLIGFILKRYPDNGECNAQLGLFLEAAGKREEAVDYYVKAAIAPSRSKMALNRLVLIWGLERKLEKIRSLAREVIVRHRNAQQAYLVLGHLAMAEGKYAEAETVFADLIEMSPNFKTAQKLLREARLRKNGTWKQEGVMIRQGPPINSPAFSIESSEHLRLFFDVITSASARNEN